MSTLKVNNLETLSGNNAITALGIDIDLQNITVPSGFPIKLDSITYKTRLSMPLSTGGAVPTKICDLGPYTKVRSDTHLYIQGFVCGRGNYSGEVHIGVRMGSSGTPIWGAYTYQSGNYMKLGVIIGRITDFTSTDETQLEFIVHSRGNNGTGERPFNTLSPNSSDEGRYPSDGSECTFNIIEVMP